MSGSAYQERMASRQAEFKKGIDGEDARRQRDDSLLSIRKNKREDKLSKRRQQVTQAEQPSAKEIAESATSNDTQIWVQKLMNGQNYDDVLSATVHFRKILSLEKNPPIQKVIDAGIVPKLVHLCTAVDYPKLQYEACWTLTNIASGTTAQTKVVLDAGAVPIFVKLLESPDEMVREQCIWALGNIAGDGHENRDLVLKSGIMPSLLKNLAHTSKISMLRNATWVLSNCVRGKPQPDFKLVAPALQAIAKLIHSNDEEVLTDVSWALSYLSDGSSERIEAVVKSGVLGRVIELLGHHNPSVQTPSLRTIGNVATGDDSQTESIVRFGAVGPLCNLMKSNRKGIKKEAVWTLSNIAAGTKAQIQSIIDANGVPDLVKLLSESEWETKKEAAWTISNLCSRASKEQISYLVSKKAIPPLCDLLACKDPKIILVSLEALQCILKQGKSDGSEKFGSTSSNRYTDLIEDADGLDKIEELQEHPNIKVYEKAAEIIEKYYSDEEENVPGMSSQTQNGQFTFGGFGQQQQQVLQNKGFGFGNQQLSQQSQQPQQPQQPFSFGQGGGFVF